MILQAGTWFGKGSWREISDSIGIKFDAIIEIKEAEQGIDLKLKVDPAAGEPLEYQVWIVENEAGLYSISVIGPSINVEGTAKLESLPHLAMFYGEDLDQITVTVFEAREVYGARGFLKRQADIFTFELALRSEREVVQSDNIITFRAT